MVHSRNTFSLDSQALALEEDIIMQAEIQRQYRVYQLLGRGAFGVVYAGERKTDHKPVAIKFVEKTKDYVNGLPREIFYMLQVKHIDGCISIIDYFCEKDGYLIIMERPEEVCDLYALTSSVKGTGEFYTRFLFMQTVQTLRELQDAGVLHLDITQRNILLDKQTSRIKLIDFGLCFAYSEDQIYRDFQGTYPPPEWMKTKQFRSAPFIAWSLGIVLYQMLFDDHPFDAYETFTGDLTFPSSTTITQEGKDLLSQLLAINPADRPTLEEVVNHPWNAAFA